MRLTRETVRGLGDRDAGKEVRDEGRELHVQSLVPDRLEDGLHAF